MPINLAEYTKNDSYYWRKDRKKFILVKSID